MSLLNTELLYLSNVGRAPRNAADPGEGPEGMNNLLRLLYDGSEEAPYPDENEVEALAAYYHVGERTVESWFGIPRGITGQRQYRNCVPLDVTGNNYPPTSPRYKPRRRVCNCTPEQRRRILLACCLAVPGGLEREPIWTKADRNGDVKLYDEDDNAMMYTLADAVAYAESVYDGDIYDRQGLSLQLAWVRIEIRDERPDGWKVHITRSYPTDGDDSDDYQCANAEEGSGEL